MNNYKKTIIVLVLLFTQSLSAQKDLSYSTGEEEVTLEFETKFALLSFSKKIDLQELKLLIPEGIKLLKVQEDQMAWNLDLINPSALNIYWVVAEFEDELKDEDYLSLLEEIKKIKYINDVSPYYTWEDHSFWSSSYFYVKLNNQNDFKLLQEQADLSEVSILGSVKYMPLWYVLSTNKSTEFALDVSNDFYTTENFSAVYIDLGSDENPFGSNQSTPVNDPLFEDQWGLSNTGQTINGSTGTTGIDVNACKAWEITRGDPGVIVAIVDDHIRPGNTMGNEHPDLLPNLLPQIGMPVSLSSTLHGIKMAGVVGAVQNNGEGISGIAPESPILPVYVNYGAGFVGSDIGFANAINEATNNGASIINCSWARPYLPSLGLTALVDAINDAMVNGRNGLGTVVVFCSHNQNGPGVAYPATLVNDEVLIVGAIDNQGNRSVVNSNVGSNYGLKLDLVAPGTDILTTYSFSNSNLYAYDSGSSPAAALVSGIAALMLSEKPCLTVKQVGDIIEKTSRKIIGTNNNYTYATTPSRPNGDWNFEMGYGLVDAYAAVEEARTLYLQDIQEGISVGHTQQPEVHRHFRIEAGKEVSLDPTIPNNNYEVIDGVAHVTLEARQEIVLRDGFVAKAVNTNGSTTGAYFHAFTNPSLTNCDDFAYPWDAGRPALVGDGSSEKVIEQSTMLSCFPNPMNRSATVAIVLSEEENVTLQLFNARGVVVKSIVLSKSLKPGEYRYEISGDELSSGIYFLKLMTEKHIETLKVIIAK